MRNTRITDQVSLTGEKVAEGDEGQAKARERVIDVNVPQVAGSALAAVIAALIAGRLGVYGTIIGAGVISVVATTGGPVLQHFLRRTGQEVKQQVKQQVRIPVITRPLGAPGQQVDDATRGTDGLSAADSKQTVALPPVRATDRTQLLDTRHLNAVGSGAHRADLSSGSQQALPTEGFTEPRTEGARWRGWRRMLLPAVLVFVVAMGGITLYEALSGNNVSGGQGGTTSIGQALDRGSSDKAPHAPDDDEPGGSDDAPVAPPTDGSSPESPRGDEDADSPAVPGGGQDEPSLEAPQDGSTDGSERQEVAPTPTPSPEHGGNGTGSGTQPGGGTTSGEDRPEDGGGGQDSGVERAPRHQQAPDSE